MGFILLLLFKCAVWTTAEEAVVLANAHLLPQGGYQRLSNINEKGMWKRGSVGVHALLYCIAFTILFCMAFTTIVFEYFTNIDRHLKVQDKDCT